MDPQQRILLQVAYQALEDSGYVPNSTLSFNTETFGCFIGAATHDYVQNLRNDIDVYYSTGSFLFFSRLDLTYKVQRDTKLVSERPSFILSWIEWTISCG